MNSSFSQDILQQLQLQNKKSQQMRLPPQFLNQSSQPNPSAPKTHYPSSHLSHLSHSSPHSPPHITYNEIIHDGQTKLKGRYKVRNCRQPNFNLKIVERKSLSREKANSLLGLKQLMKQQMERYSIKRKYQFVLQKFADNEIAESLKLDLLFLPNSVKIPHKNRYRPNKQIPKFNNIIQINGNKITEPKNPISDLLQKTPDLLDFPEIPKKTAGFELKYRRNYLNRKNEQNGKMQKYMHLETQKQKQKQKQRRRINQNSIEQKYATQPINVYQKQEQFVPLTGWL